MTDSSLQDKEKVHIHNLLKQVDIVNQLSLCKNDYAMLVNYRSIMKTVLNSTVLCMTFHYYDMFND